MRVTVLGCGASSGTPSLDYGWGNCDPDNPRNRRLRPSILVEAGEWVQYSTPGPEGASYVAICRPAFSPDRAHRDDC